MQVMMLIRKLLINKTYVLESPYISKFPGAVIYEEKMRKKV